MELSKPANGHKAAQNAPDDRYRALVESCPFALFVEVGSRIVFANRAFNRLMGGADPGDYVGRSPLEWIPETCRPGMDRFFERVRREAEEPWVQRGLWQRLDGSVFEVEVSGNQVCWEGKDGVHVVLRPITQRRELEKTLRQTEEHLRTVTHNVHAFALFTVTPEGKVATWNPGATRLFGYTESEIVGQSFDVLFTKEDRAQGAPAWELSQAAETGLAQDERWHQRKDGSILFVSGLVVSIRDETGALTGYTKVAQDNTERKRGEDALRESEIRYRQLSQELEKRVDERTKHLEQSIQTWEGFCYSIAHDLRSPLRTISGFAGALLDDYGGELDSTGRSYAERMMAAANRLDEFIQDLLDFGRLAHVDLPRTEVDLERSLQYAVSELAQEIATAHAEIHLQRPLPAVRANPAALDQVITNLLTNAIKFVAPQTTPRVEIRAEQQNGWVRLWFRDHGIGISPEHQERVFQLFERLHPRSAYPGTGVGLAIVRKAMERMGGRVGLESVAGEGASFWIELPKAEPEPPQSNSGATLP